MSLLSNEYSNKFRLMNDIDFTGKQYYIPNSSLLNREHYQTTFEASFDGNGYTLKNINIKGATNYTGLFGDARGTIRNLNVLNANIEGKDYVGIVGNANHIIGMNVKNVTVTGRNYVGLISGQSYGTLEIINVESDNKVIGTGDHIGGITGYSSRMANILVHGLDVQGPLTSENIALISPDICNNVTFIGIIENGTSSNTNIVTRYSYYNKYAVSTNISMPLDNRATSFDASYIGNMEYYKTLNILETIGVENAQDNCYFTNSGTVTCN